MTKKDAVIISKIKYFNNIINKIEARCMAVDGPVTPTLQEMREDELADIWRVLQVIKSNLDVK